MRDETLIFSGFARRRRNSLEHAQPRIGARRRQRRRIVFAFVDAMKKPAASSLTEGAEKARGLVGIDAHIETRQRDRQSSADALDIGLLRSPALEKSVDPLSRADVGQSKLLGLRKLTADSFGGPPGR